MTMNRMTDSCVKGWSDIIKIITDKNWKSLINFLRFSKKYFKKNFSVFNAIFDCIKIS